MLEKIYLFVVFHCTVLKEDRTRIYRIHIKRFLIIIERKSPKRPPENCPDILFIQPNLNRSKNYKLSKKKLFVHTASLSLSPIQELEIVKCNACAELALDPDADPEPEDAELLCLSRVRPMLALVSRAVVDLEPEAKYPPGPSRLRRLLVVVPVPVPVRVDDDDDGRLLDCWPWLWPWLGGPGTLLRTEDKPAKNLAPAVPLLEVRERWWLRSRSLGRLPRGLAAAVAVVVPGVLVVSVAGSSSRELIFAHRLSSSSSGSRQPPTPSKSRVAPPPL